MTAGALAYRRSLNLSLRNSGFSIEHPVTSLPRRRRSSKARAPPPPPPPSPPPMSTRNSAASAPNGEARARRRRVGPRRTARRSAWSSSANGEPAAAAAEEPTFAGESVCELSETARQHLLRMLAAASSRRGRMLHARRPSRRTDCFFAGRSAPGARTRRSRLRRSAARSERFSPRRRTISWRSRVPLRADARDRAGVVHRRRSDPRDACGRHAGVAAATARRHYRPQPRNRRDPTLRSA